MFRGGATYIPRNQLLHHLIRRVAFSMVAVNDEELNQEKRPSMLDQVFIKSKQQPLIPICASVALYHTYTGWKAIGKDPILVQRSMRYRVGFSSIALALMAFEVKMSS